MSSKINTQVIKDVFKTMKYSEKENLNIDSQFDQKSEGDVDAFFKQIVKNDKWSNLKNEDREKLINKLAFEIEKDTDKYATESGEMSPSYSKQKSLPFLIEMLRYYANLCYLTDEKRKDIVVSILSDANCLSSLGYILGPALASGNRVLVVTSRKLLNIVKLIELTAIKIGFPEGTISILPTPGDLEVVFKHASVATLFDKMEKKISNKKVMAVFPYSTPFIVFDNADVDSACESVVNATWNSQLLFELTAKEVFVQETIYDKFVSKLKERVLNETEQVPNLYEATLRNLISSAYKNGIEVFPTRSGDMPFGKTLFIGGRLPNMSTTNAPCISIVAFRNVDEAVSLANNNIQGLAASVWTENIGLANYVAQKLDVSNVWINSFGIYSPDVAFKPKKLSGKGYFGGIQGFNEFRYKKFSFNYEGDKIVIQGADKKFLKAIESAKKGYQSWSGSPRYTRVRSLRKLIQHVENNKDKFKSKTFPSEWFGEWKTCFYQYINMRYDFSISSPIKGYNLNVSYIPVGSLVSENDDKTLLIASILEGNTLILLNRYGELQEFYNELTNQLPSGVLSVLPYFNEASVIASKTPLVNAYFNEYTIDEDLDSCYKFTTVSSGLPDIHSKVTHVKNIWSNVGLK